MAEKAAALTLFAVSVEKEEKKKKHIPGVRHVIIWALLNAGCVVFSVAYAFIVDPSICQPPPSPPPAASSPSPCSRSRPGPEVHVVVVAGVLWCVCVVTQAAAGALALALPRHRLRLAYAALVATAAGHWMWAVLHIIMFVASDGGLSFCTALNTAVIFFSGVVDLICFRGLILRGREDGEEE